MLWLAMIYEYDEKVFHIHLSFIVHGVLVGAGSLWLRFHMELHYQGGICEQNTNLWCIVDPRLLLVQTLDEILTLVILMDLKSLVIDILRA
jgi:hypothetical protein